VSDAERGSGSKKVERMAIEFRGSFHHHPMADAAENGEAAIGTGAGEMMHAADR